MPRRKARRVVSCTQHGRDAHRLSSSRQNADRWRPRRQFAASSRASGGTGGPPVASGGPPDAPLREAKPEPALARCARCSRRAAGHHGRAARSTRGRRAASASRRSPKPHGTHAPSFLRIQAILGRTSNHSRWTTVALRCCKRGVFHRTHRNPVARPTPAAFTGCSASQRHAPPHPHPRHRHRRLRRCAE